MLPNSTINVLPKSTVASVLRSCADIAESLTAAGIDILSVSVYSDQTARILAYEPMKLDQWCQDLHLLDYIEPFEGPAYGFAGELNVKVNGVTIVCEATEKQINAILEARKCEEQKSTDP